jgi:hypothetical protein
VLARWVVVGLFGAVLGAVACGGSTDASKGGPSVAGAGGGAAGNVGQAGEPSPPSGIGIVSDALAGCRGPGDPGCDVCYWGEVDGRWCTRESGGDTDYTDYVGLDEGCPADGPRCAQCSYDSERSLRSLGERPECGCPTGTMDGDTRACSEADTCGCYCNALGKLTRACPSSGN